MIGATRRLALKRAVVAALGVAALVTASACGGDDDSTSAASGSTSSQEAKGPFKALVVLPLSGPSAVAGKAEKAGFEAGAATVNAAGGILGSTVEFKFVDDANDGTKATQAALKELSTGDYNMVVCGINGLDAVPCTAAIAKQKVLQMATAAEDEITQPATARPYTYGTLNAFPANADAVVQQLVKDSHKTVAVIGSDNPSGRAGAEAFAAAAEQAGVQIQKTVYVPDGSKDATPQVQQATAGKPQALVIMAFGLANINTLAARHKLGLMDIPVYMDPFASAFNYSMALKPPQLKGVWASAFGFNIKGHPDGETPGAKKFFAEVAKLDPQPAISIIAHAVAYNTVLLARAAAMKAKSIEPEKLVAAMPQVKTPSDVPDGFGISAWYSDPSDHRPAVQGKDFIFFPVGTFEKGVMVPAESSE